MIHRHLLLEDGGHLLLEDGLFLELDVRFRQTALYSRTAPSPGQSDLVNYDPDGRTPLSRLR